VNAAQQVAKHIGEPDIQAASCLMVAAAMRHAAADCGGASTLWGREWNRLAAHLERRAVEETLAEQDPEDHLHLVR
jgi:hypothetical protein